jgi:uncharacterized membrane protein
MIGGIWHLALAASAFVGGHLLLSWGPLRGRLVGAIGEQAFATAYSTLALAGLVWLGFAYGRAPYVELWPQAAWTWAVPIVVMPVALLLAVCGLSQYNPTVVQQNFRRADKDPAPGILKVTRHPVMWAFGLWALAHILPNGDLASLVLFGALAFLALVGTQAIEAKRRARDPEGFARFAAATSNLPLAAIVSGRATLALSDIGWARIAIATVLYIAILHGHRWIAGVAIF